jgi:hypothetical protein
VRARTGHVSLWRVAFQLFSSSLVVAAFAWFTLIAIDIFHLDLRLSECRDCGTFGNPQARAFVKDAGLSGRAVLIYQPVLLAGLAFFGSLSVVGGAASAIQWRRFRAAKISLAAAGVTAILAAVPFVFFEATIDWYSWAID